MTAGVIRDDDIARSAGGETMQPVAPLWLAGLDGQFVIADGYFWIAREGDLPAGAVPHAPRRAPLVEVAMLVVGAARRAGQHYVRPVLVREQTDGPVDTGPDTVMVDAAGLARVVDWAANEGISVVDVAGGRRLTHGARRAQPTKEVSRTASQPPASPETSACAETPEPQPAAEPARSGPALVEPPSPGGGPDGSRPASGPGHRRKEPPTRRSGRESAKSMDCRLAVPGGKELVTRSNTSAGSDTVTDLAGGTSVRPDHAVSTHEMSTAVGHLLDGFGGIAVQNELIRFAQSERWIVPAALRATGLHALTSRRDLATLAWYGVGDDWIALGGSGGKTAARVRHAPLLTALREMDFTAESDGAALDFEDYDHSSALRAGRVAELVHALRKSRRSAAKRNRKRRSAGSVDSAPVASGRDDPVPTGVEADNGESLISSDQSVAESPPPTVGKGGPAAPARFGSRARVRLDVEGFRTLAVVDLPDLGVTVTSGELKGQQFSTPTSAAEAVIERYALGGPTVADGLTCWLLDDASAQPLGEVISG